MMQTFRETTTNMASRSNTGGGVKRVAEKLRAAIERGNYYEAHQMYKTLYFRYKNQRKYADAEKLLYEGSKLLLEKDQHASGTDLALLYVELLGYYLTTVTETSLVNLSHLHKLIDSDLPDRSQFVASAIQWSRNNKEHKQGHPILHQKFACNFWEEKNYVQARYHFIHSDDGENCATMLVEYHIMYGFPSEVDLFIGQAVLQYLCLQNTATAQLALRSYTNRHPQVEGGPPFVRPLLNFLWFLLLAVESGKVTLFTILVEQYQACLSRDPLYNEYLDRIGQLFFGVPAPDDSSGMLGSLLQSIFSIDEPVAMNAVELD